MLLAMHSVSEGAGRDRNASVCEYMELLPFAAPASETISFAKALDRSVTGSMKDLVNHAKVWLGDGELSPFEVGLKLNDVLLSSLAVSKSSLYCKPREAFKDLINTFEQERE